MTEEQLTEKVSVMLQDMAGFRESLKSAHKRIDDNDAMTKQIHKLASNVETLAIQVKNQNESSEKMFEAFEARMRTQGERIGILEMKPAKKWDAIVEKVMLCVITAVVAFLLARVGLK